jgi:ribosomal protein RSM22 (predicted rRNA methylase)
LVIDDNIFERDYIMNLKNQMVALTSNTTKVCDVSKTTIYRENSLTIYAHVNDLDFIAYIVSKVVGGVSSIYSTMQSMQRKCLRTKPKHITKFPLNPRNFSTIGIYCQNGWKKLEGQ